MTEANAKKRAENRETAGKMLSPENIMRKGGGQVPDGHGGWTWKTAEQLLTPQQIADVLSGESTATPKDIRDKLARGEFVEGYSDPKTGKQLAHVNQPQAFRGPVSGAALLSASTATEGGIPTFQPDGGGALPPVGGMPGGEEALRAWLGGGKQIKTDADAAGKAIVTAGEQFAATVGGSNPGRGDNPTPTPGGTDGT